MKRKSIVSAAAAGLVLCLSVAIASCGTSVKSQSADSDTSAVAAPPATDNSVDTVAKRRPQDIPYCHILHGPKGFFYVGHYTYNEKGDLIHPYDWGVIDIKGNVIVDGKEKSLIHNGDYNFLNDKGYTLYYENGKGYGVMNDKFRTVLPAKYPDLDLFSEYAVYCDSTARKHVILDVTTGKRVGSLSMDYKIDGIGDGIVRALKDVGTKNSSRAYLSLNGKVLIPDSKLKNYSNLGDFSEGLALVLGRDKAYYIDLRGTPVITMPTTGLEDAFAYNYSVFLKFKDGYAVVYTDTGAKIIDKRGKKVNRVNITAISEEDNKLKATITRGGKKEVVFLNRNGSEANVSSSDKEGLGWEMKRENPDDYFNSKVGYADVSGKLRLPYKYGPNSTDFINGYAVVFMDDVDGVSVIDTKGRILLKSIALVNRDFLPG